jgi:hypothetical protein
MKMPQIASIASFSPRPLLTLPLAVLALALTLATPARAQITIPEEGFGIGFVLGTPTGLSASLPVGERNAFNAALGYDFTGDANLFVQADYVWIHKNIIPVDVGSVSLYYGPGAFAIAARDAAIGIRGVVGIDYRFAGAPVQIFLEVAPGISVLPDTDAHVGAGLGARYYF